MSSYSASYSDNAQSSQSVSGNTFGGVNFGAYADRSANIPAFLANRGTPNAPTELGAGSSILQLSIYGGIALVVTALVIRSLKNGK